MKISKVFGFVLCLHLGVIAVLIVQPGCRTTQPPTQTYQQDSRDSLSQIKPVEDLIPAVRIDEAPLDPAFNAGLQDSAAQSFAVPQDAPSQLDAEATPQLQPLPAAPVAVSVEIAEPSFEVYSVKKGDSLWAIAKRHDVTLKELYAANGLNKNSVLNIGQQIQIPVEASSVEVKAETADVYQPSGYSVASEEYVVQPGDNLSKIAAQFGTSVRALKSANNKTSELIRVGEKLLVPVAAGAAGAKLPVASDAKLASTEAGRVHIVKAGEFPATIARQYGMTTAELLAVNGITDPRKMQIGQALKVSATGSAANVASKQETVVVQPNAAGPQVTADNDAPVQIRIVEADPLIESEVTEVQAAASAAQDAAVIEVPATSEVVDPDAMFENVVEIPVIRMEDQ